MGDNLSQKSLTGFGTDDHTDHTYVAPVKLVKSSEDMQKWDRSQAYFEYLGFIYTINDCLKSVNNSEGSRSPSREIEMIINILNILDNWIDQFPRVQNPKRFGNPAFKTWYNKLKEESINLLQMALSESLFRAIPEIMVYLEESFGDIKNITYGLGNEISFLMFLCALFKIGFLSKEDQPVVACKVFIRYLQVVRKLQQTYRMEITDIIDSQGTWSLDDFQFVPFVWGSSQLIDRQIEPAALIKPEIVSEYAEEYMFFSCMNYIKEVKIGPYSEHSNQLWCLSGVSCWEKINQGLIKMYKSVVLNDFGVVKNIVFGSLFTLHRAEHGSSIRRPITCAVKLPIDELSKEPSVAMIYKEKDDTEKSTSTSEAPSAQISIEQLKEDSLEQISINTFSNNTTNTE